jgi:phosphoglycolate phosphatase
VSDGIELVLFDLDGTLVETAPEICDAVNDTLASLGLPAARLEQVEQWIGHGTECLLQQALAQACGRDAAALAGTSLWRAARPRFAWDYERRCGTTSRLYPRAREVLNTLRERGVRRALVTNKEQRFTLPVLRRHGLRASFERVVCGDTLPTKKPDPAGVLDCLHRFGVGADRALFVGDSSIDVATARNAGVRVWALAQGYNMGQPIAAARPDRVIDGLAALLSLSPGASAVRR